MPFGEGVSPMDLSTSWVTMLFIYWYLHFFLFNFIFSGKSQYNWQRHVEILSQYATVQKNQEFVLYMGIFTIISLNSKLGIFMFPCPSLIYQSKVFTNIKNGCSITIDYKFFYTKTYFQQSVLKEFSVKVFSLSLLYLL